MAFKPGVKCPLVCSIISVVLVAIVTGLAIAWSPIFTAAFHSQINSNLAITGPDGKSWQYFASTNFKGAPIIYESYSFFNLTNKEAFLNGSKPILKEVGPFVYRYTKVKVNPQFNADKSEISYTRQVYYNFEPSLSYADPATVQITTMNPPYLGALSHAKSERLLATAYTAVVEREVFGFLTSQFWSDGQTYLGGPVMGSTAAQVIENYRKENPTVPEQEAKNWFYEVWANSTMEFNASNPDGYLLQAFQLSAFNGNQSTGITREQAQNLFDETKSGSLTYPAEGWEQGSTLQWKRALTDVITATQLAQSFHLQMKQVLLISKWLNASIVLDRITSPGIFSQYKVNSVEQVACLHWANGGFAANQSIATLYPHLFGLGIPEYYWWSKAHSMFTSSLDTDQCMNLFYGKRPITDSQNLGNFLLDLFNTTKLKEDYNVSLDILQLLEMSFFFIGNETDSMTASYGIPRVAYWLNHGSGLIVTRSAHEWLWNYTDPLVIRLLPNAPPMSFKHNMSSPEFAEAHTGRWTVGTGVPKIEQLQNTIVWDGFSVSPFYANPVQVHGSTEDGQYPPFLSCETQTLDTWVDDYARDVPMVCIDDDVMHFDVKTYRFTPDNSTWRPNPYLDSMVDGFSNISAKYNDSPVFLSNPHFFGVPSYWPDRLEGDAGIKNLTTDLTLVDVEPYTGKVTSFVKGLQANLYIKNDTIWFDGGYNPHVYKDVMFPVLFGVMRTTVTPELTHLITSTVYRALKAKVIIQYVLVGLSASLAIVAISLIVLVIYRSKRQEAGYTLIQ